MKFLNRFILLAVIFSGCSANQDYIDTKLLGKWTDYNNRYQFNPDHTYSINYLRSGLGADTVLIDSVFGTYQLNKKRSNLTFFQEGYRNRNSAGTITYQKTNATTWNYTIENDTVVKYTSNTTLGRLFKK